MTDEIKPALEPDQWDSVRADTDEVGYGPLQGIGIGYTNGHFPTGHLSNAYDPVALIALLNHALPDDSPYKLTRADVACAIEYANALESYRGSGAHTAPADDPLTRLAAKLAALLPPEGR